MKHKYIIFGLKIASELKLGLLPTAKYQDEPDIHIHIKKVVKPRKGIKDTVYKPNTIISKSVCYWEVDNIAKYLIKGSDTVYVQKGKDATWRDVFTFFMETVLTILLIKNDIFVFHASAIRAKGKAYVFCSGSGNGKSTLAGLLMRKGHKIIEDDKCLLTWDAKKKQVFIENGIPLLELWTPQQALGIKSKAKRLGRVRKDIPKIRFDISDIVPKRRTPVEKIFLILMDNHEDDKITQKPITGINKVSIVKNYSHLEYLIKPLGKAKEHFKYVAQIATKLPVYRISRSRLTKLDDSIKFIENEITSGATKK